MEAPRPHDRPWHRRVRRWSIRHSALMEAAYGVYAGALLHLRPLAAALRAGRLTGAVTATERHVKGLLFDCRMCGTCILSSTGMACPMTCPKQLRNGPCGGVGEGGRCEVEPSMPCVWLDAWRGAGQMRGQWRIRKPQPPVDHSLAGRSTWLALMEGRHETVPTRPPERAPWLQLAPDDPPAWGPPVGNLSARLGAGEFTVTAEYNPPDTPDAEEIVSRAAPLIEVCDAINVTDGAGGNTHISSAAVCALLARAGAEPVMQISCRDRNRIAIQADALGAAALGIRNVLCLTGDGIGQGDQPDAKPVFDLDATALLETLRTMRDAGTFRSGRELQQAPALFLGATSNPFAIPPQVEVQRVHKKIAAGAQFLQSQFCYDLDALRAFLALYTDRGLHERSRYIVGVGPLRSARIARWMRDHVPGVRIPDALIARLEGAENQREEGIRICVETIQELRELPGVAGVHVMAYRQPKTVRQIVTRAGLRVDRPAASRTAG